MAEIQIGEVSDFFHRPVVAGIDLTGDLKIGDRIHIMGHTTEMEFNVDSMQIDGGVITQARAGDSVGLKVPDRVRKGDKVYRVVA